MMINLAKGEKSYPSDFAHVLELASTQVWGHFGTFLDTSGHFWTLQTSLGAPEIKNFVCSPKESKSSIKMLSYEKKSFGVGSVVAENEQKTCESPESSALRDHPGKSYLAPGSRPGYGGRPGAAVIRDSRTFLLVLRDYRNGSISIFFI